MDKQNPISPTDFDLLLFVGDSALPRKQDPCFLQSVHLLAAIGDLPVAPVNMMFFGDTESFTAGEDTQ